MDDRDRPDDPLTASGTNVLVVPPVELLTDGRAGRTVATVAPIDLTPVGAVETLVVPESGSFLR